MIYRGVPLEAETKRRGRRDPVKTEERRKVRRDLLKAAGIAVGTAAVIEALIFLSTKLGM